MKDEGWRMKEERWRFQAVGGFDDKQTDGQTFVNVESLSRLKKALSMLISTFVTFWPKISIFLLKIAQNNSIFTTEVISQISCLFYIWIVTALTSSSFGFVYFIYFLSDRVSSILTIIMDHIVAVGG